MSDEESFVILGTSPMPSMEIDGLPSRYTSSDTSSLQSDTPGSRFTSLKSSQINDLQNAQEIGTPTVQEDKEQHKQIIKEAEEEFIPALSKEIQRSKASHFSNIQSKINPTDIQTETQMDDSEIPIVQMEITQTKRLYPSNVQPEMAEVKIIQKPTDIQTKTQMEITPKQNLNQQKDADIKLWSKQPKVELFKSIEPFSLVDLALQSPLAEQQKSTNQEQSKKQKITNSIETQTSNSQENIKMTTSGNSNKTTPPSSVDSNLAASFILGEVEGDVLKTSVFSQFPSISMSASDEDVVKLQNMVTEYNELKDTVAKANLTMKKFHSYTLDWRRKTQATEEYYKQQLDSCRQEIEMLRRENQELQNSFKAQIEAVEVARRKDRDETVQIISEKNALLENLRTQIVKLEQQQLASFEVVYKNQSPEDREEFKKFYITRREHDEKIKELERKLSELLAHNLDFKDVEKQYIDELNCLKVNLTAAEELIKENKAKINELQTNIKEKQENIEVLECSLNELREINNKQSERITLLEHQTEVHRRDFDMECESKKMALKEKQQLLVDLRNLQRHNQELIAEHQKLAQNYEKRLRGSTGNAGHITAATADASSFYNNPQRPIRVSTNLPSTSSTGPAASAALMHYCPICNKGFKSLNILQSHVNDCIDRN